MAALMTILLLVGAGGSAVASDPMLPDAPSASAPLPGDHDALRAIELLNEAFLTHLDGLPQSYALAAEQVRAGWREQYADAAPESFVTDALAVLYPEFARALSAFDSDDLADAERGFAALRTATDPYLAANARYFHARSLVGLGHYDGAAEAIASPALEDMDRYSAYGPHARFLLAASRARLLEYDEAQPLLSELIVGGGRRPEAVRVAARQLQLELERRESGTLGEVATIMDFVADHLKVADARQRVQDRQQEILDLLDKLIEQEQQKEQQGGGGGRGGQPREGGQPSGAPPSSPREESEAPEGGGRIGDLHAAPDVDPSEMWGKLPPAERERILQAIRERYPSRYRQIVEQYYRSLAEEK